MDRQLPTKESYAGSSPAGDAVTSAVTREERARVLLGDGTSRCNKMHLAAGWGFEWRWEDEGPEKSGLMRSRMLFLVDGEWRRAKSWDEDVRPSLRDSKAPVA